MRNKYSGYLVMLILILVLPGCWDQREIEDLAIITGMGIDTITIEDREMFQVSFTIFRPGLAKGGGGGGEGGGASAAQQAAFYLISGTGETILDASRNMSSRLPRVQFLSPIMVVIVGEKLARSGSDKFIDVFERQEDFRLRTLIFVVKGSAMEALAAQPEVETNLADEIQGIAQKGQPYWGKSYKSDLLEFLRTLSSGGHDPVVGKLEMAKPPENNLYSEKQIESVGRVENAPILSGAAVFKKGKLSGFLSNTESRGFLLVSGKVTQGVLPLAIPEQHGDRVAVSITKNKSKITPEIKADKIKFKVEIEVIGDLYEHEGTEPVATPEMHDIFEKYMALEVKKLAETTIDKAQKEFKADIFGLGNHLYRKDPKLWREIEPKWRDEIYPRAEITVNVKAHIRTTGQIGDSFPIN